MTEIQFNLPVNIELGSMFESLSDTGTTIIIPVDQNGDIIVDFNLGNVELGQVERLRDNLLMSISNDLGSVTNEGEIGGYKIRFAVFAENKNEIIESEKLAEPFLNLYRFAINNNIKKLRIPGIMNSVKNNYSDFISTWYALYLGMNDVNEASIKIVIPEIHKQLVDFDSLITNK